MKFDPRVEEAIEILYIDEDYESGERALQLLKEAAEEGDGDAYFILGRCYAGPYFTSSEFGFKENLRLSTQYFNNSIEHGSAVGMMATRRLGDFKPRSGSFIHAPYRSNREIWDAVAEMALDGNLFCEVLIANAYYYHDAIELMELNLEHYTDKERMQLDHALSMASLPFYEDVFEHGITIGYGNYYELVSGNDGDIARDEKKLKAFKKLAKSYGYYFED